MTKRCKWTSGLSLSVLLFSAACQLNDTDSAPLAPDSVDDTESSASPAQANPTSVGSAPGRSPDSTSANTDGGAASQQGAPPFASDAGIDAAATPGFPFLPSLEAGSLAPGNFGAQNDAAINDAGSFPNI